MIDKESVVTNGIHNISVRYTFESWSLSGDHLIQGIGFKVCRIDKMYGENVEDALRRVATMLRRDHKELERMEITCEAEGVTQVFKYNL